MFQLNKEEFNNLKFHFGTSSYGGRRYLPYVFTELGVAMLSSVLNSSRAININIQIMRTFVKLRELLSSNSELSAKIELLERKFDNKDIRPYRRIIFTSRHEGGISRSIPSTRNSFRLKFKIVFDAIRDIREAKKEDLTTIKEIGFKG